MPASSVGLPPITFVKPRNGMIHKDSNGSFYVQAAGRRFYHPSRLPEFRGGQRVKICFDIPGSRIVSVWRGDNLIGDFYDFTPGSPS